jgi:hypothetical protein
MFQAVLNREVASKTGESVSTIREMGFVPLTTVPFEREPLVVDWDELQQQRDVVLPRHQARHTAVA